MIAIYLKGEKMEHCPWLNQLDQNSSLYMPYNVDYDFQYFPELKKKLKLLINILEKNNAPKALIVCAKNYKNKVVKAIDLYYKGNIIDSHLIIKDLVKDCYGKYSVFDVNNNPAFPASPQKEGNEVQLFRARLSDHMIEFPAEEMLHIPFKNRSIVKSERFSIPGLPCLYLGNTSYVCWIEMGCPPDFKFNVSPVVLDNTQKIFNLAVSLQDFYNTLDYNKTTREEGFCYLIKLFILNMATSFRVKETNRNFKSEYIISQMVMLACKDLQLDGITYHSKCVSNDNFANVLGVNLVLFAKYDGKGVLSKICEHLEIGDSFNYSMYKQLLASQKYKGYRLRIDDPSLNKNIGSFKRQFPYRETMFYGFDRYLFANWEDRKISKKYERILKV